MQLITEDEVRKSISLHPSLLVEISTGFVELVDGQVQMPPILRLDIPEHHGEVDVKTAYLPKFPYFAIKVSTGFFDNYKQGLANANGFMTLLETATGRPIALLADNGYLTLIRTAIAGALATNLLSLPDANVAAVIGVGEQARYQIRALSLVREIKQLLVYGRKVEQVQRFVKAMESELQIPVIPCPTVAKAIAGAEIIYTTTPAKEPLISADMLRPRQHITAVGSDAEGKKELAMSVLQRADRIVVDSLKQSVRLGELQAVSEDSVLHKVVELGNVIKSPRLGRTTEEQITVCDLTGTGMQDTVIANITYARWLSMASDPNKGATS